MGRASRYSCRVDAFSSKLPSPSSQTPSLHLVRRVSPSFLRGRLRGFLRGRLRGFLRGRLRAFLRGRLRGFLRGRLRDFLRSHLRNFRGRSCGYGRSRHDRSWLIYHRRFVVDPHTRLKQLDVHLDAREAVEVRERFDFADLAARDQVALSDIVVLEAATHA